MLGAPAAIVEILPNEEKPMRALRQRHFRGGLGAADGAREMLHLARGHAQGAVACLPGAVAQIGVLEVVGVKSGSGRPTQKQRAAQAAAASTG